MSPFEVNTFLGISLKSYNSKKENDIGFLKMCIA